MAKHVDNPSYSACVVYTKYLYLPSTVIIAQVLVAPSKQLKQIIQFEHNIVKNLNWQETDQLGVCRRG